MNIRTATQIFPGGVGLAGATVSTNTGVTATTLSNGTYSLTGLAPGTYTGTPSKAGYSLTPASQSVTVYTVNRTGINFTATQTAAPVPGGGEVTGDASGDTHWGGPTRPDEAGIYYGQDEEAERMAGPGFIEETAGETPGGAAHTDASAEVSAEASELAPGPAALQDLKAAFYAWDHLGTPRLISNADRTLMERHDYEPFGLEIVPMQVSTTTHRFTGHERDVLDALSHTTLDYMHFRFYGPSIGRFQKPDNLWGSPQNPQSWNLYA